MRRRRDNGVPAALRPQAAPSLRRIQQLRRTARGADAGRRRQGDCPDDRAQTLRRTQGCNRRSRNPGSAGRATRPPKGRKSRSRLDAVDNPTARVRAAYRTMWGTTRGPGPACARTTAPASSHRAVSQPVHHPITDVSPTGNPGPRRWAGVGFGTAGRPLPPRAASTTPTNCEKRDTNRTGPREGPWRGESPTGRRRYTENLSAFEYTAILTKRTDFVCLHRVTDNRYQ